MIKFNTLKDIDELLKDSTGNYGIVIQTYHITEFEIIKNKLDNLGISRYIDRNYNHSNNSLFFIRKNSKHQDGPYVCTTEGFTKDVKDFGKRYGHIGYNFKEFDFGIISIEEIEKSLDILENNLKNK